MTRGIRIVAPFRPFPPESALHKELQAFDWTAAIQMMAHSAGLACHCPVSVITDVDYAAPIPALQYVTMTRRLMLWTLEVARCYLESDDFDRDTVSVDVDQLLYRDLAPGFARGVDLTVLIRPTAKHQAETRGQPLLNGVQWWALKGRDRLVAFYRAAEALAATLPEGTIRWGADTEAVRQLLEPLELGLHERAGLRVRMIDAATVIEALSEQQIRGLADGQLPWPSRAVLDFRWKRKPYMRAAYAATILKGAVA